MKGGINDSQTKRDGGLSDLQRKEKAKRGVVGELVRPSIVAMIQKKHPDWSAEGFICRSDLNHFRTEYIQTWWRKEMGELSTLELDVMRSMKDQGLLAKNVNVEFDRKSTLGERLADKVAEFGGSWRFIITFFIFVMVIVDNNEFSPIASETL